MRPHLPSLDDPACSSGAKLAPGGHVALLDQTEDQERQAEEGEAARRA
jgi:hypothetical protein